jgi:hypothetical protein
MLMSLTQGPEPRDLPPNFAGAITKALECLTLGEVEPPPNAAFPDLARICCPMVELPSTKTEVRLVSYCEMVQLWFKFLTDVRDGSLRTKHGFCRRRSSLCLTLDFRLFVRANKTHGHFTTSQHWHRVVHKNDYLPLDPVNRVDQTTLLRSLWFFTHA